MKAGRRKCERRGNSEPLKSFSWLPAFLILSPEAGSGIQIRARDLAALGAVVEVVDDRGWPAAVVAARYPARLNGHPIGHARTNMGYATVKVLFDVSAEDLHGHLTRHIALYRPRQKDTENFQVDVMAGQHCSAVWSNDLACPGMFLYPVGHQLATLWMDVRYQDGDAWDLSCYSAFRHELTHSVNPWPNEPGFVYDADEEKRIQYRINKLSKLLPQFADLIRPYLLLWRYPKDFASPKKLVDRKGKARPTDHFEYGDAYQYHDFLSCFGVDVTKPVHQVMVRI